MNPGKAIRKRRKALGWSLRRLQGECGVSNPFLSQIENGTNASIQTLAKIAKGLKCSIVELVK